MITRTAAAVCLALTAGLCSADEQGLPLQRFPLPAQNGPSVPLGDVALPPALDPIDLPAQQGPVAVEDIDLALQQAIPLTLVGTDSRDGRTQSQLIVTDAPERGEVRVQRQVTLPDGRIATQEGIGRVRGDRIKVTLDGTQGLTDLGAGQALEPVDLNLRLDRSSGVLNAEGLCSTHEFSAQATDASHVAPILDQNQSRTRTFLGKIKATWQKLIAKVKSLYFGARAKFSAWRAHRAEKRGSSATEDAARHRERAQRFAARARGQELAPVPAGPVAIQRPAIQGQALPVIAGPPAPAQQALPQVDAQLAQTGVQEIEPTATPKKRNFFSRMWRRMFKRADR
ncbi:MAG: hypothetical protein R3F62_30015 [Planctomycetota bacterium]